jgi:hypothetical protein
MGLPMTKAIEEVFNYLPKIVDKKKVCEGCRDRTKCQDCRFQESHSKEWNHGDCQRRKSAEKEDFDKSPEGSAEEGKKALTERPNQ